MIFFLAKRVISVERQADDRLVFFFLDTASAYVINVKNLWPNYGVATNSACFH